jgi:hypothetical protein
VRVQQVDVRAGPIAAAALPDVRARIWQIGPLTKSDVELAMIGRCAALGGLVGMDVQGLTREVVDGEVRASGAATDIGELRHVDVLKADEEEILTYTGAASLEAAVADVRAAGVREVLITRGSEGAVVYGAGAAIAIAAVPPRRTVDATGCGDTYLAAYLARRLDSDDLRECGEFAAAAAAINLEAFGAFRGSAAAPRSPGGRSRRCAMNRARAPACCSPTIYPTWIGQPPRTQVDAPRQKIGCTGRSTGRSRKRRRISR